MKNRSTPPKRRSGSIRTSPLGMSIWPIATYLDHLGEAENTVRRASERGLDIPDLLVLRYYLAFLKGDKAGMGREEVSAKGKPGAEDWVSHSEALTLSRSGQSALARRMLRRAVDL